MSTTPEPATSDPPFPPTITSLLYDLRTLGVTPGMVVIVHSSLRAIADWVIGGPTAVILALEGAIGPTGTLVMPTMTGELSDPGQWVNPPVPAAWWSLIRAEMPAYRPDLSVTRKMGLIAETFRKQDGVVRSQHPHTSFAAWGRHAATIAADHVLESALGERSPLARIYDLAGSVLLLGVGHGNNTSLHLAEHRANFAGKQMHRNRAPVLINGERRWVEFDDLDEDNDDFEQIGGDFAQTTGLERSGKVGAADALLMPQRALVDFAVRWIERNRQ